MWHRWLLHFSLLPNNIPGMAVPHFHSQASGQHSDLVFQRSVVLSTHHQGNAYPSLRGRNGGLSVLLAVFVFGKLLG